VTNNDMQRDTLGLALKYCNASR